MNRVKSPVFRLKQKLYWCSELVRIERSALVPFSDKQMFALINDIERYPEYMPGCVGAEVLGHGEHWVDARLDLAKMGVKQSFSTHNTLLPPSSMKMSLIEGPFKRLEGEWQFQSLSDSACKVVFWLEFDVSFSIMAVALPRLMEHVASEQVDALCRRAKDTYGSA